MVFVHSTTPLSNAEIFTRLTNLRQHAFAPYSNYLVSCLVEIKIAENSYFYIGGVNVENDEHNRLSLHSEQNALASAITLLGEDTKFSKMWVMAAPANAEPDGNQEAGKACGHCRQIMMSLAKKDAEIYTVTLDGRFSEPDSFERKFLPDSFCERDLNLSAQPSHPVNLETWELLSKAKNLNETQIASILKKLSPHIINPKFQTSGITACLLKCSNGNYAAGVLVQDIAFLTTDAIFGAIGNAVTQFGYQDLKFDEIHLATSSLNPAELSSTEIEALSHGYASDKTIVNFYTPEGQHASFTLMECKNARNEKLNKLLTKG